MRVGDRVFVDLHYMDGGRRVEACPCGCGRSGFYEGVVKGAVRPGTLTPCGLPIVPVEGPDGRHGEVTSCVSAIEPPA